MMTTESPCRHICQLSADQTVCVGCHRTLAEIAGWRNLSEAEKIRINLAARERRLASGREIDIDLS